VKPKNISFISSDTLVFGEIRILVMKTPGHTPGSCSFYIQESDVVFTGDTLFKEGIGEHRHAYSNVMDLMRSVKLLLSLPEQTTVYPGHGEETIIFDERKGH
jgi:hydroxyacylglutathione hydrolase